MSWNIFAYIHGYKGAIVSNLPGHFLAITDLKVANDHTSTLHKQIPQLDFTYTHLSMIIKGNLPSLSVLHTRTPRPLTWLLKIKIHQKNNKNHTLW